MAKKQEQTAEMTHDQKIHNLRKQLKDLNAQYRRLEIKARYKQSEELDQEMDAVTDSIADTEAELEAAIEAKREADQAHQEEVKRAERERLAEKAQGFSFVVPDDDPLLACTMLGAIGQRLQYEFCRSQAPYESLTAKVYGRNADGSGNNGDAGTHSDPSYEFNRDDVDKLDQMRDRREYLQTLRMAAYKHFEAMKDQLPEDTPFIPTFQRQTDDQLVRQLEERQQQRWAEQQEARRQAGEAVRDYTRTDLGII